jgi:hypothetical protein
MRHPDLNRGMEVLQTSFLNAKAIMGKTLMKAKK